MKSYKEGFLKTKYTARFWLGRLQIQVWKNPWFGVIVYDGHGFDTDMVKGLFHAKN